LVSTYESASRHDPEHRLPQRRKNLKSHIWITFFTVWEVGRGVSHWCFTTKLSLNMAVWASVVLLHRADAQNWSLLI
jgi:hypothetical protein